MTSTLFVLAGGRDRLYEDYSINLGKLLQRWVDKPKVLSCFFAKDTEMWETAASEWEQWFRKCLGEDINYQFARPETFSEQLKWADVVYFHGGTTFLLKEILDTFPELSSQLKGKVVVGSSAGANVLAGTYYSPKRDKVGKGLGFVPFASVVHYGAEGDGEVSLDTARWQQVIERTQAAKAVDETLLLLPEGTFTAIVQ
jgi:peptidase E